MIIGLLRKYWIYIFIITLILRIENIIVFSSLNIDKVIQLAATYNLVKGNGILLTTAFTAHQFEAEFIPFFGWPPGFTFCILPLYLFFKNLIVANQITDGIFIILFFVATWLIIKRLFNENKKEIFASFCLLSMFNFAPFHYYTSTDLYSLVFLLFSLILYIDIFDSQKIQFHKIIFASVFLFLATLTRFSYFPIAISAPVAFMLISYYNKNTINIKKGATLLLFSIIFISAIFIFQKQYYGNSSYLENQKFAFYPKNLLQIDPFVYHAFFFTESFETIKLGNLSCYTILHPFELLFTFVMLILFVGEFYLRRKVKSILNTFDLLTMVIMLSVGGMLIVLSLVSKPQIFEGNSNWTYVSEERYFAPIMFVFQIYVCRMLFMNKKRALTIFYRTLTIFSFSFSLIYFSFKHYKVLVSHQTEGTFQTDSKNVFELNKQIKKKIEKDVPLLVATPNLTTKTAAIFEGAIPVNDYDSLLHYDFKNVHNKNLLVECDQPPSFNQEDFIRKNNAILSFTINDKDWYLARIK